MTTEQIAKVCHTVNAAYCRVYDDFTQVPWCDAPKWQRDSCISGVKMHQEQPHATPGQSHEEWLKLKKAEGWVYGPYKNVGLKYHPCIKPYNELPSFDKAKDHIFKAIVNSLSDA